MTAVVINAETLGAAARLGQNLWQEAKECRYQVITLAPEALKSYEFRDLIKDDCFRARWGVLTVDEAHLTYEWGVDFRLIYGEIWTLRAYAPDHVVFVALSASVEPGHETKEVIRRIGFRAGNYHFDRRDCERHNVDYIFRDIQFASTAHAFRDLDWLIPPDLRKASDIIKRLLFTDTIERGHRITLYLRSLLPEHLKKLAHTIIRHMHSMNCPDCKREGMVALYQTGDERETALFVASPILEVGIDVPDIGEVVLYPEPSSASSCVQRAGRPARGPDTAHGRAIVYIKKSSIDAAMEYVASIANSVRS